MRMVRRHPRRALEKGDQMRYKATFIAGVAVGFIAGARAGRGAYDKIVGYGQQIAGHPKVQEAKSAAQVKAVDLAKTAAAKVPDVAKSAASSATSAAKAAQAQVSQVPKYVSTAKEAAASKIPARLGGTSGAADPADPAEDGAIVVVVPDDIAPDGNLVYPADGGSPSVNGTHYTPDTP